MEDKPEHQHQLNRRIRVPGLTAGRSPPRCLPLGEGGLIQPEGQVTAPLQASFVGRPILDPIAGLRDAVIPRSTVDWDTSQADDFRRRGEPWTIKRTRLERARAR